MQDAAPGPSTAVEMQTSRQTGVTSIWLASGVRVHHRRIERVRDQVVVTLAMSGGELLETAETRGLSRLSAAVLDRWTLVAPIAASRAAPGANIRIAAGAPVDGLQLRLVCDAPSLGVGIDALRELIASPSISKDVLNDARDALSAEMGQDARDGRARAARLVRSLMSPFPPDDPRAREPDVRQLQAVTADQVSAWIRSHSAKDASTIEIAVVGDVSLSVALRAVDSAIGSLPSRPRPAPGADVRISRIARAVEPIRVVRTLPGAGTGATVHSGFVAPDVDRLDDQRTLRVAGRVLLQRVREAAGGSVMRRDEGTFAMSPVPIRGVGTFLLSVPASRENAEAVLAIVDAEIERMVREPVAEAELAEAAAPLLQAAKEFASDSRYWSGVLARCSALGLEPDEIDAAAAHYAALTPDALRDAMRRYAIPDARVRVTILPAE